MYVYKGVVCLSVLFAKNLSCQGLVNLKTTKRVADSQRKKETQSSVWQKESLFEGLVDWGIGVQGGGTIVHELGGVVGGDGAEVAAVWGVGQAGHHSHHLCYLLLQLCDLLLPLVDLACMRHRKQRGFQDGQNSPHRNLQTKSVLFVYRGGK